MATSGRNQSEAFEALKVFMRENFNAKLASGGREILKRCHFCGDSRDPSKAHMYIGLKDGSIVYNCFKCNSKGIVDDKFLRDIGCYDQSILDLCREQNKQGSRSNNVKSGDSRPIYRSRHLMIPIQYNNQNAVNTKLQYLASRLGYIFNLHDAARFKIILNLKEFLLYNGFTRFTRTEDVVNILDEHFIGFLSMDNSYVILRRLPPEGVLPEFIDLRYVNYDIFGYNGLKYYAIANTINKASPMEIHIAEGAFDIMSIYMNIAPFGTNGLFVSVGGKSYKTLVRFLISTYGFGGFTLHLYPDADIDISQMQYIKNDIAPFNIPIFVHRNTFPGEKDYGVPVDRIKDSVSKL